MRSELKERSQIAESIRAARLNAGMSQRALADAVYRHTMTVYDWENDTHVPTCDAAIDVARVLNVSLDTLLLGDEAEQIRCVRCRHWRIMNAVKTDEGKRARCEMSSMWHPRAQDYCSLAEPRKDKLG